MGFVNERISAEDIKKYDLENISKKYIVGGVPITDWTIDRGRDIYLRLVRRGREEYAHESVWNFYWRGTLIHLDANMIGGGGGRGEPGWTHWRVVWMSPIEPSLKEEMLSDLREAFLAYKDGGIFSSNTTYEVILDTAEGV